MGLAQSAAHVTFSTYELPPRLVPSLFLALAFVFRGINSGRLGKGRNFLRLVDRGDPTRTSRAYPQSRAFLAGAGGKERGKEITCRLLLSQGPSTAQGSCQALGWNHERHPRLLPDRNDTIGIRESRVGTRTGERDAQAP